MSRVIQITNPTTVRNQHRRTIAEILRQLSQKPHIDSEAKDMAAMLIFLLREIKQGVDQTVQAWEKRDYWLKAERFSRDWDWVEETAVNLEDVIRHEAWDLLPELLSDLFVHFTDIKIKKMTRTSNDWRGAYRKLLAEPPTELPW